MRFVSERAKPETKSLSTDRSLCTRGEMLDCEIPGALHFFQKSKPAKTLDSKEAPKDSEEALAPRALVCVHCGHRITTASARIPVGGSHEHTRMNPHGFVFHIGCFSSAPGCLPQGSPSTYWSWFSGYSWQVVVCGGCRMHLGWAFRSSEDSFHGLILDKLIEIE